MSYGMMHEYEVKRAQLAASYRAGRLAAEARRQLWSKFLCWLGCTPDGQPQHQLITGRA